VELFGYVLQNLAKRPARTAFVAGAGFLASLVMVFAFALGTRVSRHIRVDTQAKWTGHLWVSADRDFQFKEQDVERYRAQAEAVREVLGAHPNTAILTPWAQVWCSMQAGRSRTSITVSATDFALDRPYREQTELAEGRFPGDGDEYGCLLSAYLAERYNLAVGDSITLFIPSAFGARNAMDFVIVGLFRSSAPWYDDSATIRAQDYAELSELGGGLMPFYKAYVKRESALPAMTAALNARLTDFRAKGYRDDEFVRFLLSLGTSNILLFGFLAMVMFLALLIGIRSVIMTNIFDRRDEIGTLRAIGFPRRTVQALFLGEALLGLLAGYLLGALAVAALAVSFRLLVVRPPLLMLQYMFGMTRLALDINALTLGAPLALLLGILLASTWWTVRRETEKQAVAQMSGR
jgi:ABC-type lipoprotein release transport system permease subunit